MGYRTAVPIGSGGMGDVYKAWDPELERWVALKYLRHDSPELVERMFREARAQARIDHPGVCKVYEVGEDEGRPYIAMQYVEGPALDAAAPTMVLEQKVLVVKEVAKAVAAAHAAGLIHRDLKPGNIKVSESEDGRLRPYVLDFGIAREQEVAGLTATGQILGTPGYLSPEQARGEVSELDRRTDVFSLGVILYEILSGAHPYAGNSDAERVAKLLMGEPTPLRRISPDVPQDLETIVMNCLEDNRDRRYPSARALADDLGRFLDGEPVEARPISVFGRVVRRARRNKALATVVAVLAVIVIGLAIALVGSWIKYTADLKNERNEALEARQEAELREAEAREIADFVGEIFAVAKPGQGESVTARELLEEKALKAARELGDRPIERARLINVIAGSFRRLGLYDQATEYAIRGYHLRVDALGEDDLAVAESLDMLASISVSEFKYREAADYGRRALEIQRHHLGDDDPVVAQTKCGLANSLGALRELDEADALSRECLTVLLPAYGRSHPETLEALSIRAILLRRMGQTDEAERLYLDLLERQRAVHGAVSTEVAKTLNNLAYLLKTRGDSKGAEQRYLEAMAIQDEVLGRIHPWSITVRQNLASAVFEQGKLDEVAAYLREVLELRRQLHPPGHSMIGSALVNGIGRFLVSQKKYDEAEPLLREGVEILENAEGVDIAYTEIARGSLAACLFGLGETGEAIRLARGSLRVLEGRDGFTRVESWNLPFVAEHFETAGQPELAARYRALIEE